MRCASSVVTGAVALLICSMAGARAADAPPPAAAESGVTLGEMRLQTLPAKTYAYVTAETSFEKMAEPVKAGFEAVFKAVADGKLRVGGPTMMIYQGSPHFETQKDFKVEVGVIVADDTAAPAGGGDVKVRKAEPFRCASILYTGPVNRQGEAYAKLIPALRAAGHAPSGEEREMCLYFEGMESPNNVFMIMIGVK